MRQLEEYERWEQSGDLSIVRSRAALDVESALPKAILLMEGADPIRTPEEAPHWFERGVRIVGLTWAMGTRYAGGNHAHGPLTPLGAHMVSALDEVGIIHDASHLSDEAFDGLLARARGPIIASHSNCRALVEPKQRHLRDDQIKVIGDRGGVIGLNLYTSFLAVGRRATIDDCIAHVEHVAGVMGHRRGVALGSDMDGGFGPEKLPVGLEHPTRLDRIAEALSKRGWPDGDIANFAWGNWRRFLDENLAKPVGRTDPLTSDLWPLASDPDL
jgi:membrane dipeptidase